MSEKESESVGGWKFREAREKEKLKEKKKEITHSRTY